MRLAGNRGIFQGRLQVLDVYYTFCCPFGYRPHGTDQHKGRVVVWEVPYYTGTPSDLPIQPLSGIVGTDTAPVFAGKVALGQSFPNAGDYPKDCVNLQSGGPRQEKFAKKDFCKIKLIF